MMVAGIAQKIPAASADLSSVLKHLDNAVNTCRHLGKGLMPIDDTPGAFWRSLEALCKEVQQLTGTHCSFSMSGAFDAVPTAIGNHLYRIVQEAMGNAIKHGHATDIQVKLSEARGQCHLLVQDNGTGLILPTAGSDVASGIGLKTMKARADIFGAELLVTSTHPQGVTVSVQWRRPDKRCR